nr:hypothetical protein JVH1_5365 [Rhodococcus sp. JVH1]
MGASWGSGRKISLCFDLDVLRRSECPMTVSSVDALCVHSPFPLA